MTTDKEDHSIIHVAVRGMKVGFAEHEYKGAEGTVRFCLSEKTTSSPGTHFGLFVNGDAYTKDVLRWPRERRICALVESPINPCFRDPAELERRFPLILTHRQELISRGPPFQELLFGTSWLGLSSPAAVNSIRHEHPHKSRLVSFMGSIQHASTGAYQFRQEVAAAMLRRSEVECFGKGIREIQGKRQALEAYRFSIAMENAAEDMYFSEKLIDCILLETVPIYYGCRGISKVLNPRGLMRFSTLKELNGILDGLSDKLWSEMYPAAVENKQRVLENGWYSHRSLLDRIALTSLASVGDMQSLLPSHFPITNEKWGGKLLKRISRRMRNS